MNWHPLTLGIWLLLGISWLIYLPMAWRLVVLLPGWRPQAGDACQLKAEREMEWVAHQSRRVTVLQTGALVLWVAGVSSAWPAYVSGAMCGTGVLQAMGVSGKQTLFYHVVTVGVLLCAGAVRRLDASHPYGLLSAWHGRLLLLAAPLMTLQAMAWIHSTGAAAGSPPVNCCAVVYHQAGVTVADLVFPVVRGHHWLAVCLLGAAVIAGWGGRQGRRGGTPLFCVTLTALTVVWMWTALMALKTGVTPYIYQTLAHPCPWCLFLADHGAVGVLYFSLLAWILVESLTMAVAGIVAGQVPDLHPAASRSLQKAGLRLMAGVLIFSAALFWPALFWRYSHGVWLT